MSAFRYFRFLSVRAFLSCGRVEGRRIGVCCGRILVMGDIVFFRSCFRTKGIRNGSKFAFYGLLR